MIHPGSADCIAVLHQGLELIEALSSEDYECLGDALPSDQTVWSSPGAHTRHILDFFDCLLVGLEAGRIDYTQRKRRLEIELSREVGARESMRTIENLERIGSTDPNQTIDVRPDTNQQWTRSTVGRELQFLTGHAIHHYALIRLTLAHRGIEAPPEYGVAPSTLEHRAQHLTRDRPSAAVGPNSR